MEEYVALGGFAGLEGGGLEDRFGEFEHDDGEEQEEAVGPEDEHGDFEVVVLGGADYAAFVEADRDYEEDFGPFGQCFCQFHV